MKMNKRNIFSILTVLFAVIIITACGPSHGNETGHEFMPDMSHSAAYEANTLTYYYYNTWGSEEDYKKMAMPRKPVAGTIPRGYSGAASSHAMTQTNAISIPSNGSVPYYYGDSDAERIRASDELINNPYPISEEGLARGKNLYNIQCGLCHGEKGDAKGYLVRPEEEGGVYPAAPANFLTEAFIDTTNGAYYHAILHGKNVMGSYADKLSYEERWQVIHYIRLLQAKSLKLEYSAEKNTLNSVDVPAAEFVSTLPAMDKEAVHEGDGHGNDDAHGHDDGHGHDGDAEHKNDHDESGHKEEGKEDKDHGNHGGH